MEKIVCALWRKADEAREEFNARLLEGLPGALRDAGASGVRINLRDDHVEPASALVQQWQEPQQDAVAQFWLASANARFRDKAEAALTAYCDRFHAWLVAESTIIANEAQVGFGQRGEGWSQATFLSFRSDKAHEAALAHWHGHHTRVAIETQSNFEYIQNLIVMALTEGAPSYDAFVEECFPDAAMSDPAAFFDAVGDRQKFDANLARMMDSCNGFIDFSRIDVIPTSQYNFADTREEIPA